MVPTNADGAVIDVQGHSLGANSLLLLIAVILFILAAFGAPISSFSELDTACLAAAFGFGSFLL